jgi:DNA invertase Pin-like site-specific DNA recombinase
MTFIINKKNIAIIYCRISRVPDAERGIMSLDSQEFAIKRFLETRKMGVFSIFKNTGSAFKTPQTELKNFLKTCKNKILVVYEPNRLSRNTINFMEIVKICIKNKHKIAVVNIDSVFDMNDHTDYNNLKNLIEISQRESEEMGRRISRTYQYKKSREPAWGKMRNDCDRIIDNPLEQKINKLIKLLGTTGSSFTEVKNLINEVGVTFNKEAFEIVEYDNKSTTDLRIVDDKMPYEMSIKNIIDTLKYYEIRRRKRLNWTNIEIQEILQNRSINNTVNIDSLCEDLNTVANLSRTVSTPTQQVQIQPSQNIPGWIRIWFIPEIGLPPNIRLPEGMTIPTEACEIFIPRM